VTSDEAKRIEASIEQLGEKLLTRYCEHGYKAGNEECLINKCQISSLTFAPFNSYPFVINTSVLNEAVNQIKMDIRFVYLRQDELIGDLRINEGKVAGIITYRLARAHIINLCKTCCDCVERCIAQLNLTIAISIGLEYIHKKYDDLPDGLRQELGYAIIYRHVNQEMLGLVFDTFNNEFFHAKNERKIP